MTPVLLAVVLLAAACGCPRKTEHRGSGDEPSGTYKRALDVADSAAAGAGRRAAYMDSASAGDR